MKSKTKTFKIITVIVLFGIIIFSIFCFINVGSFGDRLCDERSLLDGAEMEYRVDILKSSLSLVFWWLYAVGCLLVCLCIRDIKFLIPYIVLCLAFFISWAYLQTDSIERVMAFIGDNSKMDFIAQIDRSLSTVALSYVYAAAFMFISFIAMFIPDIIRIAKE